MNIIKKTFKQSLNLMNLGIRLAIITSLTLVTACSVHKGEFDCPGNKGMGCKGMIDVYDTLHQKTPLAPISNVVPTFNPHKLDNKSENIDDAVNGMKNEQTPINPIYRSSDKILKIWFNGYFDSLNNYRDSQYVYAVISPAGWIINNH